MFDDTEKVIAKYLKTNTPNKQIEWSGNEGDEDARLRRTYVKSLDEQGRFQTAAPVEIGIECEILKPMNNLILGFTLYSEFGYELAYVLHDDKKNEPSETIEPGKYFSKFIIPGNMLANGLYRVEIDLGIHGVKRIIHDTGTLIFTLLNTEGLGRRFPLPKMRGRSGLFRPDWSVSE